MLRIGTGIARGRRLKSVTGDIRPTGSRVRGSLFDILSARIVDSTVLDLCAGTGSLGIEALSRGARCCLFVDRDRRAVRSIKDNLALCGLRGSSRIWMTDAVRGLDHLANHACAVTSYSPIRPMAIRSHGKSSGPSANGTCWLQAACSSWSIAETINRNPAEVSTWCAAERSVTRRCHSFSPLRRIP